MGPGDISQDPLFVTGAMGDYFLAHTGTGHPTNSPCVNAGDSLQMTYPLALEDLLHGWTTRIDSGYDIEELDIGFHYPVGVLVGVAENPANRCMPVRVSPNPARGPVRFSLPGTGFGPTRLEVFGSDGRRVRRIDGAGVMAWDGRDQAGRRVAAGVYSWRLTSGVGSTSGRLVRLD
jgi:hypothetical protein